MADKSWRHIAQATAAIARCVSVAFATWKTGSVWCLLGILPAVLMVDVI